MKKRYTVKQVVKLEERKNNLSEVDYRMEEMYSFPLLALTMVGLALTFGFLKEQCQSVLPLVLSGGATVFGAGCLTDLLTAGVRTDALRGKLNDIYEEMGPQFKAEVKQEVQNRLEL